MWEVACPRDFAARAGHGPEGFGNKDMTTDSDANGGRQPRPTTGEPAVDAALSRLDHLDEAPVSEHVAVYDDVHRNLQDALADLDED